MNLSNILNYVDAEWQYWKSLSKDEPNYIAEQSIWRLAQVKEKSPECLADSGCKLCGCQFPEKSFESQGCEGGCYPPRMSEQDWDKFKETNNLKIS